MANIFNKRMNSNKKTDLEKLIKETSEIKCIPICELDMYVKCPYNDQPCEYFPAEGMENRGEEILHLRKTKQRIFKNSEGISKKIKLPNYKDLCKTCKYTNHPGKSTKSYISENLK